MLTDTPRIYVGCLAAYNSGILHGEWIDCDKDEDYITYKIGLILATSPAPDAEEWLIFDHENWRGIAIDETEILSRLVESAKALKKHGTAYAAFCKYYGSYATVENFENEYIGLYSSKEDFAYEQWKESGMLDNLEKIGMNESYIDFEAIAQDMFIDEYLAIFSSWDEVYVFSRY